MKRHPKVIEMIQKIQDSIEDIQKVNELKEDVPLLETALLCYESDIQKADETGHGYFLKLIENIPESKKDLDLIKMAHSKLKQYSE
jgi:hypothetical protein